MNNDLRWIEEDGVVNNQEYVIARAPPDLPHWKNLRTSRFVVSQTVLMLVHILVTFCFKCEEMVFGERCDNLNVMLLLQILNWGVAFAFHLCFEEQHNCLRIQGYYTIYKRLSRLSSYLFYILTWWNVITILILAISISRAADEICNWKILYSAINLTTFCTFGFGLVFLYVAVVYINAVTTGLNEIRTVSDFEVIRIWRSEIEEAARRNIGPEHGGLIRLLERQSSIIEYYQERNNKIMRWVSEKFNDLPSDA